MTKAQRNENADQARHPSMLISFCMTEEALLIIEPHSDLSFRRTHMPLCW